MELANKNCIVIGASGAIGAAVAEAFATEGARLALTYFSEKPKVLEADATPKFRRAIVHRLDVTNRKQVDVLISRVAKKFGSIHCLVNCSGAQGPIGSTHEVSVENWVHTIEANLMGSFYLVRAVVPFMLASGGGKIINFSGGGAAYGRPFFTAYASSKAGLVRFTESVAAELQDKNIQINAIAPGAVMSRMWDQLRASADAGGPQAVEELRKMDATGGVSPDCAAGLAVFLASDKSNGLTGRLISAVHDKWRGIEGHISRILGSEAGTLRRIPLD